MSRNIILPQDIGRIAGDIAASCDSLEKEAFAAYWYRYAAMTARCPECGQTEIVNRHHDGQTGGVPECDFFQCEFCAHQWGHE